MWLQGLLGPRWPAICLPLVSNQEWFFDTELLVRAERSACASTRSPSTGSDDLDSRVDVIHTALEDLRGVCRASLRVRRRPGAGPCAVGARSPDGRNPPSPIRGHRRHQHRGRPRAVPPLATGTGHVGCQCRGPRLCSTANLVANRRITFSDRAPFPRRDQWLGGLAVFATSLTLTTGALLAVAGIGASSVASDLVPSWWPTARPLWSASSSYGLGSFASTAIQTIPTIRSSE